MMKSIIVDRRYSIINSDPSLAFFALSVSAKDLHTRALSVYFSALMGKLGDISVPLTSMGVFSPLRNVYVFGRIMAGEYLLYVVGKYEDVEKMMGDMWEFIEGKKSNLDDIGKLFDQMAAKVPRIRSLPSPVYALYRFAWEKLLHIDGEDDVDVMYLNKINLILRRSDSSLFLTSIDKYDTNVVDRPVLVIGDIPENYDVVDKLVEGIKYTARLYLHPLRSIEDVIYGYKAKLWYQEKGYGVVFERIRDYLMLYVYGKNKIPQLPNRTLLGGYEILLKELFADPIYRIEALAMSGHVLTNGTLGVLSDTEWDDAMKVEFTIRGREHGGKS